MFGNPLVHTEAARTEALCHVALLLERPIAVIAVVGREREVGDSMEPPLVNRLPPFAQLGLPGVTRRLGHHVLNGELAALESTDDVDALLAVAVLEPVVQIELAVTDAIEVPGPHRPSKLGIAREATSPALVCEQICHDLDVVTTRRHALLGLAWRVSKILLSAFDGTAHTQRRKTYVSMMPSTSATPASSILPSLRYSRRLSR